MAPKKRNAAAMNDPAPEVEPTEMNVLVQDTTAVEEEEEVFPVKMLLNKGPRTSHLGFGPDIEDMLFGFGDAWPADPAVVQAIEDIVTGYIRDLALKALKVAECRPGGKLDKECFLFLVRKESQKFKRVHHLLAVNEELKAVKKIDITQSEQTATAEPAL